MAGSVSLVGRGWIFWLYAFSACVLAEVPSGDALHWLNRMHGAAQKLNYAGTFVHMQSGGQPQTSRVMHVNEGPIERERLEILDGAPLVVVRTNEQVKSYAPETRTVTVERRTVKSSFPALFSDQISAIAQVYDARKGETGRIAGLECQTVILDSRDKLRYSHKLWADMASGLLLKAQSINEKGEIVEQVAFTQVEIGGAPERYLSRLPKREGGRNWKTSIPAVRPIRFADLGWHIENPLPGFRKILELRRDIGAVDVGQVVFTDGLASVSVFLEPVRPGVRPFEGVSNQGAVNVFRRRVGDHLVTVLGEAPPACVTRIAQAVEYRPATVRQ